MGDPRRREAGDKYSLNCVLVFLLLPNIVFLEVIPECAYIQIAVSLKILQHVIHNLEF